MNLLLINHPQKISLLINEEKSFFLSLSTLLDHQNFVIRGKAIISFYLLFKMDFKYLKNVSEGKFFTWIEKMMKDNSKYVPYCLQHFIVLFDEIIPNVLKLIENEFKKCISSLNENNLDFFENQKNKEFNGNNARNNIKMVNANFNYLPCIFQILSTSNFKMRYLNSTLISMVFGFWEFCSDNKLASKVLNFFYI